MSNPKDNTNPTRIIVPVNFHTKRATGQGEENASIQRDQESAQRGEQTAKTIMQALYQDDAFSQEKLSAVAVILALKIKQALQAYTSSEANDTLTPARQRIFLQSVIHHCSCIFYEKKTKTPKEAPPVEQAHQQVFIGIVRNRLTKLLSPELQGVIKDAPDKGR